MESKTVTDKEIDEVYSEIVEGWKDRGRPLTAHQKRFLKKRLKNPKKDSVYYVQMCGSARVLIESLLESLQENNKDKIAEKMAKEWVIAYDGKLKLDYLQIRSLQDAAFQEKVIEC